MDHLRVVRWAANLETSGEEAMVIAAADAGAKEDDALNVVIESFKIFKSL